MPWILMIERLALLYHCTSGQNQAKLLFIEESGTFYQLLKLLLLEIRNKYQMILKIFSSKINTADLR